MKYLLSILCLFVLSCDSDGDGVCSYENACNYGENTECYYFFPADSVDDGDEYHCGDMQVLQDIIDINASADFTFENVSDFFIIEDNEEGYLTAVPSCILSETGRVTHFYINNNLNTIILPESIGALSNLIVLVLSNNQLTSLPESIGALSNLIFLL